MSFNSFAPVNVETGGGKKIRLLLNMPGPIHFITK
jgi:hypothetical protein